MQADRENLDAWVESFEVPFTTLMDPAGAGMRITEKVGRRETAFVVELETLKVTARTESLPAIYAELDSL